jgi:transcriptional regulator with XRE-family HTH domain
MKSSIYQPAERPFPREAWARDPVLARAIGAELKRLRRARGLTQSEVAAPLSKALVSAVENGRTVPSIPALALFLERLGTPLETFFRAVNHHMTGVYYPRHERSPNASPALRRQRRPPARPDHRRAHS